MASCFLPSTISVIVQLINDIQQSRSFSSSSSGQSFAFLQDLQHLGNMFTRIQEVLRDAEKDILDETVKLWLSEISDVAYDAEDVLDEFRYQILLAEVEARPDVAGTGQVGKQQKGSPPHPFTDMRWTREMKFADLRRSTSEIKERLDELSEVRNNLWLGDEHGKRHSSIATYNPPPTTNQAWSIVYGREIEKEEVIQLLLSENDSNLSRVASSDKGDVGNTTSASFLPSSISAVIQLISDIQKSLSSSSESSERSNAFMKDMQDMGRMFKRIQAVLHDAEERDIQDESVKHWLSEIKDVAYDAEDVLDEFQYEVLRAQVDDISDGDETDDFDHIRDVKGKRNARVVFGSTLGSSYGVSWQIGLQKRITDIKERLNEISEAREKLWLGDEHGKRHSSSVAYSPPPTTYQAKSNVYRRETEKDEIRHSKLSTVAITGTGGVGKTTLAQLVYYDREVLEYFDERSLVYVSTDFDVVRIGRTILEELTEAYVKDNELFRLKQKLDKKLKGKKFLLVLDDVWNESRALWQTLEGLLSGAKLVRILLTTRHQGVTRFMKSVKLFKLSYLPEKECWQLFENYTFDGESSSELLHLVEIGKKIVKRCHGLPLLVKSLGCLLRNEFNIDKWDDVLHSKLWDLDKEDGILSALKISYNRMPSYLKSCFAYCSIFPKGCVLDRDQLANLWISQGFIQPESGRSLEDIAEGYIDELLRRSLLEWGSDLGRNGMMMHDTIHDLANYVSNSECGTVVDGKLDCFGTSHRMRHLYVDRSTVRCDINPNALRTFIEMTGDNTGKIYSASLQSKIRLRALELNLFGSPLHSEITIGNLKHLRYLLIKGVTITQLPDSVCDMLNLQALHLIDLPIEVLPTTFRNLLSLRSLSLRDCRRLKEFPHSVGCLSKLCHLDLRDTNIRWLPTSFWRLRNLEVIYVHPDGTEKTISVEEKLKKGDQTEHLQLS